MYATDKYEQCSAGALGLAYCPVGLMCSVPFESCCHLLWCVFPNGCLDILVYGWCETCF